MKRFFEIASGEPLTIAINPIQIKKGFVAIHVGKYTTFLLDAVQFNEFLKCIPNDAKIEYKIVKTGVQKITKKDELLLKKAEEAVRERDSIYLFIL